MGQAPADRGRIFASQWLTRAVASSRGARHRRGAARHARKRASTGKPSRSGRALPQPRGLYPSEFQLGQTCRTTGCPHMANYPSRPPCTMQHAWQACSFLRCAAVHGSRAAESQAREDTRVAGPQSIPPAPGESQSQVPLLHRTGTLTLEVQPSETPERFGASPP